MAELGGIFDPGTVSDDRELLPTGEALAQIFESELIRKDASGNVITDPNVPSSKERLTLGWEILAGPLQGRKFWTGDNVKNPNATTQEIGQRALKRMCEAAGTGPISNSESLHFKPMLINIGVDKGKDGYADKNDIKGWKKVGPAGAATPAPPAPQTNGTGQPPAGLATSTTGAVPWPSR